MTWLNPRVWVEAPDFSRGTTTHVIFPFWYSMRFGEGAPKRMKRRFEAC